MLLAVNIGNSNFRFGVFKDKSLECRNSWIINSKTSRRSDEHIILFQSLYNQYGIPWKKIKTIVIGSVVPDLTYFIRNLLSSIHKFNPIVVNRYSRSTINHHSYQLGTDLYANAVAAYELYKKTSLIIDFGTALSLTCVDSNAQFKGVIIAPGINSALGSLIQNTSNLLNVKLKKPVHLLGLHTKTCIQSGMIYGYLSMIEGLIERINLEIREKCHVIATGGMAHLYGPLTKKIHQVDKLHTLKGLALLAKFNKKII